MPQPDSRVAATWSSTLRPRGPDSRTVENAPGPAEDRRFGRRLAVVLVAVLVVAVGAFVGERVLGHRNAVPVVGSWVLHEIEQDGRTTVTPDDLADDQATYTARFTADGTSFVDRGCGTPIGDYDVSWHHLTFSNLGMNASGCGWTRASSERLAGLVSGGVDAALDDGATVSRPSADRLELSVDDGAYVLRYDRAPG